MQMQIAILGAAILACVAPFGLAQGQSAASAPLDCSTGPLKRSYGGSDWLVYSCSDHRSIVIVSASGSRAAPFYFMFSPTASGHHLVGEGTGDRTVTDRAFAQLKGLSEAQIDQLLVQTRTPPLQ
jgi:hypothetical protein